LTDEEMAALEHWKSELQADAPRLALLEELPVKAKLKLQWKQVYLWDKATKDKLKNDCSEKGLDVGACTPVGRQRSHMCTWMQRN